MRELTEVSGNPYLSEVQEPQTGRFSVVHLLLLLLALVIAAAALFYNSPARRYPTSQLLTLEHQLLGPHLKGNKVNLRDKPARQDGRVLLFVPSVWSPDKVPHLHDQFLILPDKFRAPSASQARTIIFCRDRTVSSAGLYGTKDSSGHVSNVHGVSVQLQATDAWLFAANGDYMGNAVIQESQPDTVRVQGNQSENADRRLLVKYWITQILPEAPP